jgi:hypothetical protein
MLKQKVRVENCQLAKLWKPVILLSVNIVIIAVLLYGFEYYLQSTDPFLHKLPFDSGYHHRNRIYYENLRPPPPEGRYTWGHLIVNNELGFREQDFAIPKPAEICRIMVLGDSLTWGAGLAVEERYSYLTEAELRRVFSGKQIEVLNFGLPNAPTTLERDILAEHIREVNPDLIVVGFVLNDPQPKSQDYSFEKESFYEQYGWFLKPNLLSRGLRKMGLPLIGKATQQALDNFVIIVGIIPPWEVGLQRTYEPDSKEWNEFTQALKDIKTMSDEMDLPHPIFAVLNQLMPLDYGTDYQTIDETLPIYLQWFHQAQRAADEIGFETHNHEKELIEQLRPEEIPVNELDNHPSTKVNQIYAQKLFDIIADYIDQDELCHSP